MVTIPILLALWPAWPQKKKGRCFLPELCFDRSVLSFPVKQLNARLVSISRMPSGMFSWIIHHRDGNIIRLLWYPPLAGLRFARESSKALGPAVNCQGFQGSWHTHA